MPASPWSLDLPSFVLGFLASGIIGFILQRIRTQRGILGAPGRPMAVLTKQTPSDVQAAASKAFWRYLGWIFVLILSLLLLIAGIYVAMVI